MKNILTIFQIFLCIILSALIFLQSKGANENSNILSESSTQRRGWEKVLFNSTLFIILIFLISSIIQSTL